MKEDKSVCTSPPLAPQWQLRGGEVESCEMAMVESDPERGCRKDGKSKYIDKTERYGIVLNTLLENKMQAIKRQSVDNSVGKKKRNNQKQSTGRMASKFVTKCVRRNSLPDTKVPHTENEGDVEMGLIRVDCIMVRESLTEQLDNRDQAEYIVNEISSSQTKHQSDTLCDNTSLQSINSIGTAFSIPLEQANRNVSDARLKVLEAKSVSAQASPIFPPRATTQPVVTENLIKVRLEHNKLQSRTLVPSISNRSPAITSTTSSSSHGGFISSFNELASSNNLSNLMNINLPVISSTICHAKKNTICSTPKPCADSTGQRATVSTTLDYEQRTDRKWPYASANDLMSDTIAADSGSIGSERQEWKTSRRKYRHRGSDPVLIYPSSSGLSQCLLTMPPNRSIQIKYDDNTMYDVSLELDRKSSKKNGNGASVIGRKSSQRQQHDGFPHLPPHNQHHRHHRHHHSHNHDGEKRSRRHRKRILVHDLDTQRVKVIDPDDLSQRARWTIIATACLLLIMCLLLVGITLRMAPLIDDMVRQENERLMKESFERSRFLRNLTVELESASSP